MDRIAFPLEHVPVQSDGDEAVLVHRGRTASYRVNAVGRFIAEQLQHPAPLSAIHQRVHEAFDVDPAEAETAVESFVAHLRKLEIVDVIEDPDPLRRRYLELLKRALTNLIYPEHELRIRHLEEHGAAEDRLAHDRFMRDIRYLDPAMFTKITEAKRVGRPWTKLLVSYAHTMVGLRRLDNLDYCASYVFANDIPGDFLEAGVAAGGASILLRAMQVAHGQEQRKTWLADSFQGLPISDHPIDAHLNLSEERIPWAAIGLQNVKDNFATYDLLSDNVCFIEGWFSDTLPNAPVEQLAILRLDADLYASTRDVLVNLYDKVVPGGFIIIDDYGAFAVCRKAVHEFMESRGIEVRLRFIDQDGVYWQKTP